MLEQVFTFFRAAPEAALFLSIGAGFAIGKVSFGSFRLGGICGTLMVALGLGQIGISVPSVLKNFAFACFIFALGFGAGPQLFSQLESPAWRVAVLSLSECICVISVVLVASWLLGLDPGTAAGLLAGGATESALLGTASDALARLPRSAAEVAGLQSNIAIAYSISYVCGLLTILIFSRQLAPWLLRVELAQEATKLWLALGGAKVQSHSFRLLPRFLIRRFVFTRDDLPSVAEVERAGDRRILVQTVARAGRLLRVTGRLRLQLRDDLLVSGERDALIRATEALGSERVEAQETSEPLVSREFLIARKVATAHTLDDLAREGAEARRGTLQIESLQRGRHELPLLPATPLVRGDLVQAVGDPAELDRFAERVGIALSPTSVSSLLMLSGGVMLGYSLGFPRIVVAGVELSLGPGGGCLLAGLMLGWAHAKWRWLGAIPDVANDLLKDLGLSIFIASIGLAAGTRALDVLRQFGWTLPIASLLVTLLPALTSLFLGRHLLKLEPPILLGAIAGQQCSPPAIDTIVRAAGNTSPMLGYTVTYALSNVLLPLLGPLIVSLVAR